MVSPELAGAEVAEEAIAGSKGALANETVTVVTGDTTDRRTLDQLGADGYQHVLVLAYSDTLDPQEADARTLVTLLHLRNIADKGGHPFSIVSEMMDMRNRQLAEVTRADDFVVSSKLVALMLSQLSENRELEPVFRDLFDPEGVEIYVKPAEDYVVLGRAANYYTVLEAALRRGETALGYRLHAEAGEAAKSYGVHLNPAKSQRVAFAEGDRIIVLAED